MGVWTKIKDESQVNLGFPPFVFFSVFCLLISSNAWLPRAINITMHMGANVTEWRANAPNRALHMVG